jgi:hypothetical protein
MSTLTLLATAHIQSFLFQRANKLSESIGASGLVEQVFDEFKDRPEKIFVGGGRAALRFEGPDSPQKAKEAVKGWSRRQLESAPGLRLLAVHVGYKSGELQKAFRRAHDHYLLELQENQLPFGSAMGALPITRTCPSTALAANRFYLSADNSENGQWINAEAFAKRFAEADEESRGRQNMGRKFPRDLERMGLRKGDSQIALIHADGDGIGEELREIVNSGGDQNLGDDAFVNQLRAFSKAITNLNQSARKALQADLDEATLSIIENRLIEESNYFPFRPLIGAGDDVTFITPARLGLALACRYVELFRQYSRQAVKEYGSKSTELSASAGILLMPRKFPFARGYHLLEEIASSAKRSRRQAKSKEPWIDFHILHESVTGSLETIRGHYLLGSQHNLLTRPYSLSRFKENFEPLWRHLYRNWPRSSAKTLLESLSRGPAFTAERLQYFRSRHCQFPPELQVPQDGWTEGATRTTPLFDPLEFLDQYVPIQWDTHQVALPQRSDYRRSHHAHDREAAHV